MWSLFVNREQFEKLEDVKNRLAQGGVYWDGIKYSTLPFMSSFVSTAIFLNGAWYAYQEQQKKIDVKNKKILHLLEDYNLRSDPFNMDVNSCISEVVSDLEELLK